MTETEFTYMGKQVVLREETPEAVVSVDGRDFACHYHEPGEGGGLAMWMCEEAYFTSPDLTGLARHFADYGYMFDDPGRVAVDVEGNVLAPKESVAKKSAKKTTASRSNRTSRQGGGR